MSKSRKSLALILALAMVINCLMGLTAFAFTDTDGHWASEVIDKWADKGVVNGYEDGSFGPDNNITRAELTKIVVEAQGKTGLTPISFSDVSSAEWYYTYVQRGVAAGFITGDAEGTFRPEENITREEACAIFARAYSKNATTELTFSDSAAVSDWAVGYVQAMVAAGAVNGYTDGSFKPQNPITRAEAVKILDGASAKSSNNNNLIPGIIGGGGGSTGGGGGSTTNTVSVTYYAENGTFNGVFADGSVKKVTSVNSGSSFNPPADPTCTNGQFAGWFTTRDAAQKLDTNYQWLSSDKVTRSLILYAGYKASGITAYFEPNNGEAVKAVSVSEGESFSAPAGITRNGWTLEGWYTDEALTTKAAFPTTIKADAHYYAKWTLDDATKTVSTIASSTSTEGSAKAYPSEAVAGDTVKVVVDESTGYVASGVSIEYTDKNGAKKTIEATENTDGTYSFTMPDDAAADSAFNIVPKFEAAATATPKPSAGPVVTATPAPTATPDTTGIVWDFGQAPFYNEEIGGIDTTIFPAGSADGRFNVTTSSIDGSAKFSGLKFTVTGTLENAVQGWKDKSFGDEYNTGAHGYCIKTSGASSESNRVFSFKLDRPAKVTIYGAAGGSADTTATIAYGGYGKNTKSVKYTAKSTDYAPFTSDEIPANQTIYVYADGNLQLARIQADYTGSVVTPEPATPTPATATPAPPTETPDVTDYLATIDADNVKGGTIELSKTAPKMSLADGEMEYINQDFENVTDVASIPGFTVSYIGEEGTGAADTEITDQILKGKLSAGDMISSNDVGGYNNGQHDKVMKIGPYTKVSIKTGAGSTGVYTYSGDYYAGYNDPAPHIFYDIYDSTLNKHIAKAGVTQVNEDGESGLKRRLYPLIYGDSTAKTSDDYWNGDSDNEIHYAWFHFEVTIDLDNKTVTMNFVNGKGGSGSGEKVGSYTTDGFIPDTIDIFEGANNHTYVDNIKLTGPAGSGIPSTPTPVVTDAPATETPATATPVPDPAGSVRAKSGETIYVTGTAANGTDVITAVTAAGATDIKEVSDNVWSFKMPAANVAVGATFGAKVVPTETPDDTEYLAQIGTITGGSVELTKTAPSVNLAAAGDETVWNFSQAPFMTEEGTPDTTLFPVGNHSSGSRYDITPTSITADKFNGLAFVPGGTLENNFQGSTRTFADGFKSTWLIKTGSAAPYFTYTPATNGTLSVYARSGSGSADNVASIVQGSSTLATLTYKSDNSDKVTDTELEGDIYPVLTADVTAGSEVRITAGGNVSFYGVKFVEGEGGAPVVTDTPVVTETPATATPAPATPTPVPDPAGSVRAKAGESVYVIGTPATAGEVITAVTAAGATNISEVSDNVWSFTMPAADVTVDAAFGAKPVVTDSPESDVVLFMTAKNIADASGYTASSKPRLNEGTFAFGTASGAYTEEYAAIFGENGSKAGTDEISYLGKGNGPIALDLNIAKEGTYKLYLLGTKTNTSTAYSLKKGIEVIADAVALTASEAVGTEACIYAVELGSLSVGSYTLEITSTDFTNAYAVNIAAVVVAAYTSTPATDTPATDTPATETPATEEPIAKAVVSALDKAGYEDMYADLGITGTITDNTIAIEVPEKITVDPVKYPQTSDPQINGGGNTERPMFYGVMVTVPDGAASLSLSTVTNGGEPVVEEVDAATLTANVSDGKLYNWIQIADKDGNTADAAIADTFTWKDGDGNVVAIQKAEYTVSVKTAEIAKAIVSALDKASYAEMYADLEISGTITDNTVAIEVPAKITVDPIKYPQTGEPQINGGGNTERPMFYGVMVTVPDGAASLLLSTVTNGGQPVVEEVDAATLTANVSNGKLYNWIQIADKDGNSEEATIADTFTWKDGDGNVVATQSAAYTVSIKTVAARTTFTDNFLVKDGNADGFYVGYFATGTPPVNDAAASEANGVLSLDKRNMALELPEAVDLTNNSFNFTYDYYIDTDAFAVAYAGRSFRLFLENAATANDAATGFETEAFAADNQFFHMTDTTQGLLTSTDNTSLSANNTTNAGVKVVNATNLTGKTWYKAELDFSENEVTVKLTPYTNHDGNELDDAAAISGTGSYVADRAKSVKTIRFVQTLVQGIKFDNISYTVTPNEVPTEAPSETPSESPSEVPTEEPTETPTDTPAQEPIVVNMWDTAAVAVSKGNQTDNGAGQQYWDNTHSGDMALIKSSEVGSFVGAQGIILREGTSGAVAVNVYKTKATTATDAGATQLASRELKMTGGFTPNYDNVISFADGTTFEADDNILIKLSAVGHSGYCGNFSTTTVSFDMPRYDVTLDAFENGSATINSKSNATAGNAITRAAEGELVFVTTTVTDTDNYELSSVQYKGASEDNYAKAASIKGANTAAVAFEMPGENTTVKPDITKIPEYTVTFNGENVDSITWNGSTVSTDFVANTASVEGVKPGNYTFTITPAQDYAIISVDGATTTDNTTYSVSVTKAEGNKTINITTASANAVQSISIEGEAVVGKALTASVLPTTANVTYKWYTQDDAEGTGKAVISGAESSSFTLTEDEAGKFITVEATDEGSKTVSATTVTAVYIPKTYTYNSPATGASITAETALIDNADIIVKTTKTVATQANTQFPSQATYPYALPFRGNSAISAHLDDIVNGNAHSSDSTNLVVIPATKGKFTAYIGINAAKTMRIWDNTSDKEVLAVTPNEKKVNELSFNMEAGHEYLVYASGTGAQLVKVEYKTMDVSKVTE